MKKMKDAGLPMILTAAVMFSVAGAVPASAYPEYVTPYGAYCKDYNNYGACKEGLPQHEAMKAIDRFYRERGYRVGTFSFRGRFIEVDVYRHDRQVDRVIFDRKTGRLRSVY
ncbi:MAG: hypothetical protein EPN25_12620 [Nitrospirae bacterium]|nr:MAG: hypothetical protein EPN25_12620 [Nitrospirota bacterium]